MLAGSIREWKELRLLVLKRAGGTCEACLRRPEVLVHHVSYAMGRRPPAWMLRALCRQCHSRMRDGRRKDDWPRQSWQRVLRCSSLAIQQAIAHNSRNPKAAKPIRWKDRLCIEELSPIGIAKVARCAVKGKSEYEHRADSKATATHAPDRKPIYALREEYGSVVKSEVWHLPGPLHYFCNVDSVN
jgi:hypothetical protein